MYTKWQLFCVVLASVLLVLVGFAVKNSRKRPEYAPIGFAAFGLSAQRYTIVIQSPFAVCSVPLDGIVLDTPNMRGTITGTCEPDSVFGNGFE